MDEPAKLLTACIADKIRMRLFILEQSPNHERENNYLDPLIIPVPCCLLSFQINQINPQHIQIPQKITPDVTLQS